MAESRKLLLTRVLLDVFLASLGAIGIFLYSKLGRHVLTQTGFHCGDETLAYPYKSSTISSAVNGFVGVVVPASIVVADHFVKAKKQFVRLDKDVVCKTLGTLFPVLITFLAGIPKSRELPT